MLDEAIYPDVLVAHASERDGMLRAVLYPGQASGWRDIGFSGLRPEGRYTCDGMQEPEIVADGAGAAKARVLLSGRSEIRLRPTP